MSSGCSAAILLLNQFMATFQHGAEAEMVNLASEMGQIGPKWDKSGISLDQFQYNFAPRLKKAHICPIWGQSAPICDLANPAPGVLVWGDSAYVTWPGVTWPGLFVYVAGSAEYRHKLDIFSQLTSCSCPLSRPNAWLSECTIIKQDYAALSVENLVLFFNL